MIQVHRYLWSAFALLYPFVVWPGAQSHAGVTLAKHIFVVFFLLVGFFLEMRVHPDTHFRHLALLPRFLRVNPPLAFLLLFALVMVTAALLSPEPVAALTGSLTDYTDGLFWSFMMLGIALLLYLRTREDPAMAVWLARAVVLGGSILALLALGEVLLGQAVLYKGAPPSVLPLVTFPQKGHLAGYFVLTAGVALGLRSPLGLFLGAVGVGLAFNRAGLLALGLLGLLAVWRAPRYGILSGFVLVLGVVAGMGVVKLSTQGAIPGGAGGGTVREVADPGTFFSRLYYWRAALGGIMHRPLFGWGGGVFEHHWPRFLKRGDLEAFLEQEFGKTDSRLLEVVNPPGADPIFILRRPDGNLHALRIYSFRAHNQFLEVGLKWGLLGLSLYLFLLFLALRGILRLNPLATGLFALHLFFLFWFAIPEEEGVLWALWGAALAGGFKEGALPAVQVVPDFPKLGGRGEMAEA